MRLIFTVTALSFLSLATAAVAQVSTDDGGGISSVRDRNDIPPGRQITEAPGGDGAEIGDLDSTGRNLPDAEPIAERAGSDDDAVMRSDAASDDDADEFIAPSRRGGDEGPEAALGSRPAPSRKAVRGSKRASAGPRGGRPENRWRYQYYNGYWWYWTPNNRWAFFSGRRWIDYDSELANQWARGGAVGRGEMGLGGGGSYGLGGGYGSGGISGALGGGGVNRGLGAVGGLGTNAGAMGGGRLPGQGTAPGRSALPSLRGGASQAAGGLSPTGAGGSLGGGAGGGVTGEGLGSSLFNSSGGMAAVPGLSGTRGSLGGASGVGINAGVTVGGRSGDANTGVGGGMIGGSNIGGTGGGMRGLGSGR